MRHRGRVQRVWLLGVVACVAPFPAVAGDAPPASGTPLVREVRITGTTQIPLAQLQPLLTTRVGQPFDAAALERDVRAIEDAYRKAGFALAHVTSGYGVDDAGVVTIPVEEGRIEKLVVKGNHKTRAGVILRQLDCRIGSVYNAGALKRDRQRLYDLGFFSSVAIAPEPGSEPGKAVVAVDVKERHTGSVMLAMGYTSASGLVGFAEWSDANFLGTGQTVWLNWQRGAYSTFSLSDADSEFDTRARAGLEIGYVAPCFFSRKLSAGVRLFDASTRQFTYLSQDIDPANIKNYEWRRGAWVTVARAVGGRTAVSLLARSEEVDFDVAPPGATAPVGERVDRSSVQSLRVSVGRGRVSPLTELRGLPQTGAFLEVGRAQSSGGRSTYQKYGVTAIQYLPLTERDTLATRLQLGWSSGNVPFSELYAVGGAQTVRSYQWSRFLGTRMLVLNTEWRRKLKNGLALAGFVDLGYAWARNASLNVRDVRPAVGVGLRVVTPFGPMRIDYAYGRDGGRAHLTTGDAF